MSNGRISCQCSAADAAVCPGTAFTWLEPREDGSCGCVCHSEYRDDPQNWQPYVYNPEQDAADDALDWIERLDAAEELTDV